MSATIAGVGASARERYGTQRFQLARGLGDKQTHFPVAGVKVECDGFAAFRAQATMRAQDQEFGVEQSRGIPSHAGILRQPEEIPGGLGEQHLGSQRQRSGRTRRVRGHLE